MEKTCAIILAAGKGKRMNSLKPKVLCEILEKPMIDWILDSLNNAQIKKKCIVIGNKAEDIKNHVKNTIEFAVQKNQLGTANAVKSAINFLKDNIDKDVFVCSGDAPFINQETIINSYNLHKNSNASVTIVTAFLHDPINFGRIVRNNQNNVVKIVEEKDATNEEKKIKEANSGAYWFAVKTLIEILNYIEPKNLQKEYYLTDAIEIIIKNNKTVKAFTVTNPEIILGANTKLELLKLNEIAKNMIIEKWLEKNINFISTDGIVIYPEVEIGENSQILPGSIIKGNTIIGKNCIIGPNSLIQNSKIGDNCKINSSQVYDSSVDDFTIIGPFSHIRPNCTISHDVKIFFFFFFKNSKIGAGTSISHLTYVGDSEVGKNVNFGCGVVTINFDGVKKNKCIIKDGAFVGCNTNLVAPVTLGKNAYTAAGSTITHNVPDFSLAIERTKQLHIKDFSKTKLKNRKLKVN